jgi:hypothetical protein
VVPGGGGSGRQGEGVRISMFCWREKQEMLSEHSWLSWEESLDGASGVGSWRLGGRAVIVMK